MSKDLLNEESKTDNGPAIMDREPIVMPEKRKEIVRKLRRQKNMSMRKIKRRLDKLGDN